MTFRFVHTADLHLDSPLVALSLRDPELARQVGVATRAAFSATVELCLAEGVDALLIAGDLWDGGQVSVKAPRFLKRELTRLHDAGIRVFVIRGNHDALSKVTRELDPPPNTTIFGARAATGRFEAGGRAIAVHGLSFAEARAPESALPAYPPPEPGAFNIGMMHTSLNGSAGHDVYAPCRLADLEAHGYDYWALGHIHRRSEHRGRCAVVMPGIPQGRDIGEAGHRSVTLVTLHDDGRLDIAERVVASVRFERREVDLDGVGDWSEAVARLDHALRALAAEPRAEARLVARPRLRGATPLAWRIARDLDALTEEARATAGLLDGLSIDRIENATDGGAEGLAGTGALPDELLRIVEEELPGDPALSAALADLARDFQGNLPGEARAVFGTDEASFAAACSELLDEGTRLVLARLIDPREG
ncbi:metallophosphoesterase family protein [Amaricoccus solimangrovi]|uniref:DNA repair exonuclease n=1 Tax=Amaricoccus solimangrovi TaxID=2589815 RepID=A0A501WJ76_9RHOB|nr:DNA repair exonuclease [Amaricoccus solimangrovi]TPE49933.1 DNA repair exonuclease [Amaricoccus solimangrovi]